MRRMGSRAHGTWARLYADVWGHEKTHRLADALVRLAAVPRRWAVREAVGQLHQLACNLADKSTDGRIGHLAPREFCNWAGWDDRKKTDSVLAAWMSSGFIDNPDTPDARLHGFQEMFGELLRKRGAKHLERERVRSEKNRESSYKKQKLGAQQPPNPRPTKAKIRVLESESESNTPLLPTVGVDSPPALPPAPTKGAIDAWNAARAQRRLGKLGKQQTGQLCRVIAEIWPGAQFQEQVILDAIGAYFADRETFTVTHGHNVSEFQRRADHWLALALGTAPVPTPRGRLADMDAAKEQVLAKLTREAAQIEGGMLRLEDFDHVPSD